MHKLNWLLPAAVVVVATAGVAAYLQFVRNAWQPPKVVMIEGMDEVAALFPSYMSWMPDPEEGGKQALLLRDGDYFTWGDDASAQVRYLASDGSTLQLASGDWSLTLNGDVVAVSLSEKEALAWLAGASDEQLAKIRLVGVPDDAGPEQLASLKRLAKVNPHLDLQVESAQVLHSLLEYFQPRAVFAVDAEGLLAVLGGQPELDTLMISAPDAGSLEYLSKLPRLRRLVLGDWDPDKTGPLPAGLDTLKSLVIVSSRLKDLSALEAAPKGLEELSFSFQEDVLKLDGIEKMDNLRVLILSVGDKDPASPIPDLGALRKLRWIGLPFGTSQPQLAAIVKSNPRVEILEFPKMEKILDLAPLGELKELRGLVLGGVYENLDVVKTLGSLRFLGISEDSWPDSPDKVAEIRAALPDAVVIRIEPACLGSGWLLLLLPLLGIAWLRHETRHRPARAA